MNNLTLKQKVRIFRKKHLFFVWGLMVDIFEAEFYDDVAYTALGKKVRRILKDLDLDYNDLHDCIMAWHDMELPYIGKRRHIMVIENDTIIDMAEMVGRLGNE